MPNFRGRAPSGLISRETGNYAWVGENGEIIVDGPHCLSDNGENLLAVDPTDKGLTLNRSAVVGLIKETAGTGGTGGDYYTKSEIDTKLNSKANTSDLNNYYTKSEIDNLLSYISVYSITIEEIEGICVL